jgi:hypothetical protein
MDLENMLATARAALAFTFLLAACGTASAQTGPSDAQVIARAGTAKISLGQRKLAGHVIATVRVGADGAVKDVLVTQNTTEDGLEPQLIKVLRSAKFRPAIDANGSLVEGNAEMKVELRQSTGDSPKPVAANPDPEANEKEKARIKNMRCSDFIWEWDLIRKEAGEGTATEFMPRIATLMYSAMRTAAGDYVDARIWKEQPKALKEAVDQCRDNPATPFWDGVFKPVMDEAVPK